MWNGTEMLLWQTLKEPQNEPDGDCPLRFGASSGRPWWGVGLCVMRVPGARGSDVLAFFSPSVLSLAPSMYWAGLNWISFVIPTTGCGYFLILLALLLLVLSSPLMLWGSALPSHHTEALLLLCDDDGPLYCLLVVPELHFLREDQDCSRLEALLCACWFLGRLSQAYLVNNSLFQTEKVSSVCGRHGPFRAASVNIPQDQQPGTLLLSHCLPRVLRVSLTELATSQHKQNYKYLDSGRCMKSDWVGKTDADTPLGRSTGLNPAEILSKVRQG